MRLRLCKVPRKVQPAAPASRSVSGIAARLLTAGLATALSAACVGCSGPILSFRTEEAPTAPEPLVTGSIPKRPASFGGDLDTEDWRRAHAALSVALDPQGNGRPVKWENPETAMRGSVNPTGLPYVAGDEICRDFLASVVGGANSSAKGGVKSRFVRGTGCKPSGGEWELKRLRSAKS